MGLLTKTPPKAPEDLRAVTEQRDAAIATWRRAVAEQARATAELARVGVVAPGADRLDVYRQRQALEPARAALLEADAALEVAVRAGRAAEARWRAIYAQAHDPAAAALFARVETAGAGLSEAVEALRAWAAPHDAELLAADFAGAHRGLSWPKWASACPPWFLGDQPGMASAWDGFVAATKAERGW